MELPQDKLDLILLRHNEIDGCLAANPAALRRAGRAGAVALPRRRHFRYAGCKTITLTPEQQAWIDAHVARGEFASEEDAARRLIDSAILDLEMLGEDDLAWAKPLVDEALAASRRGEVLTLDEHRARNRARLAAMRK